MGTRALLLAGLILLPGAAVAQVKLPEARSTTLDVTRPLDDLPVAGPNASPDVVATAIQGRLDYLRLHNLPGRVFLPKGRWRINRPVFMNGDNVEIVGAGVGQTVLEPAEGYRAMPLLNMGTRTYFPERPLQTCNRVLLTDPRARVLDDSVRGPRYGLRTYAEFPGDNFPAVSHLAVDSRSAKPWGKGLSYTPDDVALVNAPPLPGPLPCVCVRKHTATPDTEPLRGKSWKVYWVAKLPFHVQFFGDPFSAGAYDPQTRRAGSWAPMDRFTLDFAFTFNAPPALYKDGRTLCGISPRGWSLSCTPDGRLTFRLPLADGTNPSVALARGCTKAGTYRLALQVDFAGRTLQAWLRRPGETAFARTLLDRKTLPEGGRFRPTEYTFFTLTGGEGGPASANRSTPPLDMTVCGLHVAAVLRYADNEALLRRDTKRPADDAFRLFANDAGTMAFLPLTENPPLEGTHTRALLVTVQHGPAAGDAGQKGYGYFKSPASIYGVGRPLVGALTIRPGPTWGVGVVTWNTLDATLRDLDIRGGYYAVGDLFLGAQYTFDVRDCVLSGSEAGFAGMSNIVYFRNVTFAPVGRCGILLSGSNCMADGVRFVDPKTFHSEYYVRQISTVQYGGMNLFTNVTAEAEKGCRLPSKAAFSQASIAGTRTSLVVRHCRVANLGPDAALVELGPFSRPAPSLLLLDDCTYHGSPIAALVRAEAPWWSGEVLRSSAGPCHKLLDYRPQAVPAWQAGRKYTTRDAVSLGGQVYRCLQEHAADAAHRPGLNEGKLFWQLSVPKIFFDGSSSRLAE